MKLKRRTKVGLKINEMVRCEAELLSDVRKLWGKWAPSLRIGTSKPVSTTRLFRAKRHAIVKIEYIFN